MKYCTCNIIGYKLTILFTGGFYHEIAVVAANGRVAQKVVKEAQDRGFEVTDFARGDENKSGAATYIKKDILELNKDDLAGEELTLNSKGESIISYADYAIAMVDEIEKGNHIQQRISVVRE